VSALYLQHIFHDPSYKQDLIEKQFPSKFNFMINECLICVEWSLYNDFIFASCGHTYYISCITYYVVFHTCCKINEGKKMSHQNWLLCIGVHPLSENTLTCFIT
jgi:hypothetical protein